MEGARKLPDVVGELSRRVPLSRATIVRILTEIDNLDQVKVNPSVFIDKVEAAINQALYNEVAKGIVYTPKGDERWSAELFKTAHQDETVAKPEFVVPVSKSVTDQVVCDSKVEVAFAQFLEQRDDVPLFLKLPHWFKIDTPLGNYNPDWAFVRKEPRGRLPLPRPRDQGHRQDREPAVGDRGLEDQVRRGALQRAQGRLLLPQRPEGPHRALACLRWVIAKILGWGRRRRPG